MGGSRSLEVCFLAQLRGELAVFKWLVNVLAPSRVITSQETE